MSASAFKLAIFARCSVDFWDVRLTPVLAFERFDALEEPDAPDTTDDALLRFARSKV